MKYVILLEDDPKIIGQIAESIFMVDATIKIRIFKDLSKLKIWTEKYAGPEYFEKAGENFDEVSNQFKGDINFNEARQRGASRGFKRLAPEISEQIIGVFLKAEFFQKDIDSVIFAKSLKEFFIKNNLYNSSDPTGFCITAFESPTFKIQNIKDPDIRNVFFKPFDRTILQQLMEFAILGYQPIKITTVHTQKTSFELEMLKEIEITSITDFGFTTISDSEVSAGTISRFYSNYFQSPTLRSVHAKSMGSAPDPQNPNQHTCYFSYFGITNEQITSLRKIIREKAKSNRGKVFRDFSKLHQFHGFSFAMIEETEAYPATGINESLERTFVNCHVAMFKSIKEFEESMDGHCVPVDGLIFSNTFWGDNEEANLNALLEKVKKCNETLGNAHNPNMPVFVMTNVPYTRAKEKELGKFVADIINLPIDRAYALKKFALFFNNPKSPAGINIELNTLIIHEKIKVGNPVQVSEISEAHILMDYHRVMHNGEFREFYLRTANENNSQELLAFCNNAEEVEEDKIKKFRHQFVYFGVRDSFLKFIRIWIRDIYINSKQAS